MKDKLKRIKLELQQEKDYYSKWFERIFYNPYDIDRNKDETLMREKH